MELREEGQAIRGRRPPADAADPHARLEAWAAASRAGREQGRPTVEQVRVGARSL